MLLLGLLALGHVLVLLIVVGVILALFPIDATIRKLIVAVVVVLVALLDLLGLI